MAKGKRARSGYEPFGIKAWNLVALDDCTELIKTALGKAIDEALEISTKEYPVRAWLEPTRQDPTRIRVWIPLGEEDAGGPAWYFSLAEIVDDHLRNYAPPINESGHAARLSAALRELADKIDANLAEARKGKR